MKNYKKIWLWVLPLIALAFIFLPLHKALASAPPTVTLGNDFKFTDSQHITGTVNGKPVTFYDSDPTDPTRNFQPQDMADPPWCNYGKSESANQRWGINISSSADLSASTITATMGLGFRNANGTKTTCDSISSINSTSLAVSSSGDAAEAAFSWVGANIVSSNGKQTFMSQSTNTDSGNVYFSGDSNNSCKPAAVIITDSLGSSSATEYNLADSSDRGAPALPSDLAAMIGDAGNCKLASQETITITGTNSAVAGAACNPNTDSNCICSSQGCVTTTSTTPPAPPDTDQCTSSNTSIGWAICPTLGLINDGFNKINSLIEGQLNFDVTQNLNANVKQAWSTFRILATSLLIIIMLVMVFSQAIGQGPFDAYTVRKLLPKIVIAVIGVQVSWYLFSWFIVLANHAGHGIQDILYVSFGGPSKFTLAALLGQLGKSTGLVVTSTTLLSGALVTVFNPFLLLMVGFTVFMAVITALAMLLFRQALIIGAMIFAPIALIAWILPGTQKYWKLWWENFSKALLLFPIIMGMIAVGRIFAWIVGAGGGSSGPFDAIAILLGFFGPYFFLPKAFKWGGQLMSQAGTAINGAFKPVTDAGRQGIKGIGERYQGKHANMLEYNKKGTKATLTRGLRRVQSGHMIPLSKRSRALALQTGNKWSQEEKDLATIYADNVYNKALTEGYNGIEPGVEAAKVALGELTRHKDSRIGEEAVKKFVATASWPEAQSMVDSEGRHIFDNNPNWTRAAAKDPETYRAVLRSRTDAAAHIIQGADERYAGTTFDSIRQETETKSASRIHYSIDKQLSNEDFSGESDGFWEEAAARATITADMTAEQRRLALEIQGSLQRRFHAIMQQGGTAPQQLLGHLANGGKLQEFATAALGGINVTQYIDRTAPDPPPAPTP